MSIRTRASTLLFSFRGRTGRADFWIVIGALLVVGALAALAPLRPETRTGVALACLWPYFAVSIRRLRDMDRSPLLVAIPPAAGAAVWVVGMSVLSFLLFASAIALVPQFFGDALLVGIRIMTWLSILPQLVFLIWIGLKRGRPVPDEAAAG